MPERITIANTSPLLYLHIVGQLDLLDTVKPVVLALRNAGLWLSDPLVAQVLRQAGEL
jgi:predicted nucleic acid-binding protein